MRLLGILKVLWFPSTFDTQTLMSSLHYVSIYQQRAELSCFFSSWFLVHRNSDYELRQNTVVVVITIISSTEPPSPENYYYRLNGYNQHHHHHRRRRQHSYDLQPSTISIQSTSSHHHRRRSSLVCNIPWTIKACGGGSDYMPLESFFDNMQSAKPTKPSKTKFDHRKARKL